jgi:uncharacterized membrane protein YdjX (TVP38/TMEM64 family)
VKADRNPALQRHLLLGCALVGLIGLAAASDTFHARSRELIELCETIIADFPLLGMALFTLLAAVSAMLAFFSSAILVPVGIEAWGLTVCFLLLWGGWFLGGVLSFGVGRFLGRVVVERVVGIERLAGFERRLNRGTRFVHILLFQAMLPSEIPGYVLGTVRYRFAPFALALAVVELPYALGTIYIGESFLEQRGWLLIALAAGGALIIALAYGVYRRWPRSLPSTRA